MGAEGESIGREEREKEDWRRATEQLLSVSTMPSELWFVLLHHFSLSAIADFNPSLPYRFPSPPGLQRLFAISFPLLSHAGPH